VEARIHSRARTESTEAKGCLRRFACTAGGDSPSEGAIWAPGGRTGTELLRGRPGWLSFLEEAAEREDAERPVFVARERELARLDSYLNTALVGQGQVVFVTGGPGRGKTALTNAFARRAMEAHPDLLVASGYCNAYSSVGDPYLPFREALGMLSGDVEPRWAASRLSSTRYAASREYLMRYLIRIILIEIVVSAILFACVPVQTPTATPISQDVISSIDAYLSNLAEEGSFSGAVLIAQGDNVLLSAGYGMADIENDVPNTPKTRFRLGSVTKQFTAMAVLTLRAQGKIDLEEHVCSHIPDCPDDWKTITIHQLLTHSSGLPDSWQFYADRNKPDVSCDPEEIIGWFEDVPLDFEPGERFSYSNTGYLLLGYLVEEVSGQSYEVLLRQQIFEPLEMTNTGYAHDDTDLAVGYSDNGFEAEFINPSLSYSAGGLYYLMLLPMTK
jgi:CubicO group peptidase (beta-lactamase class C family)